MSDSPVKVLYIAGYGRTGSTVIDRVLGAVEGFHSTGELMQVWGRGFRSNLLCGCGEPFAECGFWSRVAATAFADLDEPTLDTILEQHQIYCRGRTLPRRLAARLAAGGRQRRRRDVYRTALASLYRAVREASGCQVVVDSSKTFAYAMTLASLPEIDLRVVHLLRDSRAVAHSWQRKKRDPSFVDEERFLRRPGPARTAIGWNATNLALEALRGVGTLDCLRVRYEQFVADPARELTRICDHLGVERELSGLVHGRKVTLAPSHTVSGNPMRFQRGEIELRLDAAWVDRMPAGRRRLVAALTLPLLAAYGYLA